jgi:ubiquinone/menaquinone biosynthesis C-methylase UbiE
MSFYRNKIYPFLVTTLGNPSSIKKIRQQIISRAQGVVLEIGVGSGANFPYYDPEKVTKLYALEPNIGMIRLAERQLRQTKINFEFIDLPGEQIPLQDGTIDTAISTFTLCTISGIEDALQGIKRVLRPAGKLIFFELGLSPDNKVNYWQKIFEPIARLAYNGLSLTRDIPSFIVQSGFQIEQLETGYISKFPKSWTYCFWGNAIPENRDGKHL